MEYNRLGRSTTSVSKICLGTMHLGPKADEAESHKILDRAVEMGITFIDTANVYGGDAGKGALGGDHRHLARRPAGNAGRGGAGDEGVPPDGRPGSGERPHRLLRVQVPHSTSPRRCAGCRPTGSTFTRSTTSTAGLRRGVLGQLRAGRGRRRRALRRVQQLLRLGPGQASDAGLAPRIRRLRVRADAVQPAQPGARDGGPARGAGLRHRSAGLHAAGRWSADRQDASRSTGRAPDRSRRSTGSASARRTGSSPTSPSCVARSARPEQIVAIAWTLSTRPWPPPSSASGRSISSTGWTERPRCTSTPRLDRLDEIFNINDGRRIGPGRSPEAHSW